MNKTTLLIASILGLSGQANVYYPSLGGGGTLNPARKRREAKWSADAPRRAAQAADIAKWNAGVKRRNRAFARTGKCKRDRAASWPN